MAEEISRRVVEPEVAVDLKSGEEQHGDERDPCGAPAAPRGSGEPKREEGQSEEGKRRPNKDIEGEILREHGKDVDKQPMDERDNSTCDDKRQNYGKQPAPVSSQEEECAPGNSSAKDGPIERTINKAQVVQEFHCPQRQVPTPTTGPASNQDDNPA
ncbi:hypothetical protein GCM10017710_13630 [Arthrobacter ramosus]